MRTIVHISDLHFGRTEHSLEQALLDVIHARRPHLVIVSGDITQRAKHAEFRAAKKFFEKIHAPVFVVPGNHDVPLYSFWRRLFRPYAKYQMHIAKDLEPFFGDKEISVIGLNTVRAFKVTEGRVNQKQIERVKKIFENSSEKKIKIVVSHHPFNLPKGHIMRPLSRARSFWHHLEETGIDLLLSGHLHDTLERYVHRPYKLSRPGPILLQAGTAISTRTRRERNSFNVLKLSSNHIHIERYVANEAKDKFVIGWKEDFVQEEKIWRRIKKEKAA